MLGVRGSSSSSSHESSEEEDVSLPELDGLETNAHDDGPAGLSLLACDRTGVVGFVQS